MQAKDLFDLPDTLELFRRFFPADAAPWTWVEAIGAALASVHEPMAHESLLPPGVFIEGRVHLDPRVRLPHTATIIGPAWIGPGTELRPGALIRGNVIAGAGCVLGNACEFKNCLLLNGAQVPHFSYVGDSVLGNRSHLGAGAILSNLRLDQKPVTVHAEGKSWPTGMRKLGALVGDGAEVGCNAVLNPGVILGRGALVAPTIAVAGYVPPRTIARTREPLVFVPRRD
jgi:UDP-N-acetylglucosamine diphosphorylase / glucose-1-phosphate thymidylyltransferase / UDP-N-acetylgalactosamine diphosphorylase / glucosamine-1-phosphate N-acetyltransferase / galactosamine-1-phosphate N-acetyltransferase